MTPGLVTATTLLLGEIPSPLALIGIGLIVCGTYVHAREGASWREYFQPLFIWRMFRSLDFLPETEKRKRLGLRYAYISALCGTLGLTFDGLLARYGNPALGVSVEMMSLTGIYLLLSVTRFAPSSPSEIAVFLDRFRLNWKHLLGLGVAFGLPFILLTVAFIHAPVAHVGSMKRLSIFGAMLVALWGFGELSQPSDRRRRYRRLSFGSVIVIGAVILSLDPAEPHIVSGMDEIMRRVFD